MRLVIADDHALFRSSLRALLETHGFDIVGEAKDGREAVELAARLEPELVLMDLTMPEMNGIEATRMLTEEHPDMRVVVLTGSEADSDLFEALKAGALGYLPKNVATEPFLNLLKQALDGQPALTPDLARKVLGAFSRGSQRPSEEPGLDALTDRETQVLELMVDGITTNRSLAKHLEVSENTVKFHVRNILDKLHVRNRAQAVGHALRTGLVTPAKP